MTYTLYIGFYDSKGTYISRTTINPSKVFTIEIPENAHYISFFRSSNYGTISFSHIQIVEGSYTETTMPAYEPYGYKIPVISRGKNLLDYKKFIKEGKTFEIENGIQYENLTGTQNVTFDFTFKANTTYILSGIITGNLYFGGQLQTTNSDNVLNTYTWLTSTGSSLKVRNTSNEDLKRTLYCRLLNGTPDVTSTITNLQLEVAETKTDYEPYVEPVTTNIYLNEPLKENEYISCKEHNLPPIPTFKGTTIIEVDTNINSSNMEVVYLGKGKNQLLSETENNILNDILTDNTETEKDIYDSEIIEKLDKIIGG
jgi:hypothetical protein